MFEWLSANLPTVIVASVLVAVVGLIVVKMVKDKKSGKSSCGCGCGCEGCALSGQCGSNANNSNKSK